MRLAATAFIAATLLCSTAFAGKLGGKSFAEKVKVGDKTLVLNGMGLREATVFKVDVYAAGLYLEKKSSDGKAILKDPGPKKIVMQFVRDVGKDDLTKAWKESFAKNAGADLGPAKPGLNKLNGYMQDVEDGSVIAFTYEPGKGTKVSVNGKVKGTIKGEAFSRALFSCFIGPKPANRGLKTGLLGK